MNICSDFAFYKAYGKIVLFGGYSVLEPGNVGLVLQVNCGISTEIKKALDSCLYINLHDFKLLSKGIFVRNKLILENDKKEFIFSKNAIQYAVLYLRSIGNIIKEMDINCYSDDEMINNSQKTGFGSSAAATVSIVSAILKYHGVYDKIISYKISRYAHYKSQESVGSGIDCAAAVFGSGFFNKVNEDLSSFDKYICSNLSSPIMPFEFPRNFKVKFIFSGKSFSTKKHVQKVLEFKKKYPSDYFDIMCHYNRANVMLKNAFLACDIKLIKKYFDLSTYWKNYLCKKSGFDQEADDVGLLMKSMTANGAYVIGLSGAGGDSIFSICLNDFDCDQLVKFAKENCLIVFDNLSIVNQNFMRNNRMSSQNVQSEL